jgi:CRP-like cAMP-binding protein
MLKATKSLEHRQFAPGETILHQGQQNDHFYIISKGQTDVLIRAADGNQVPVARLGPGQYFGEMSLLNRPPDVLYPPDALYPRTSASVQAALHEPVQVVTLERGVFTELMDEADAMREALTRTVHERTTQNSALLSRKRGQQAYGVATSSRGGLRAQTSLA